MRVKYLSVALLGSLESAVSLSVPLTHEHFLPDLKCWTIVHLKVYIFLFFSLIILLRFFLRHIKKIFLSTQLLCSGPSGVIEWAYGKMQEVSWKSINTISHRKHCITHCCILQKLQFFISSLLNSFARTTNKCLDKTDWIKVFEWYIIIKLYCCVCVCTCTHRDSKF